MNCTEYLKDLINKLDSTLGSVMERRIYTRSVTELIENAEATAKVLLMAGENPEVLNTVLNSIRVVKYAVQEYEKIITKNYMDLVDRVMAEGLEYVIMKEMARLKHEVGKL